MEFNGGFRYGCIDLSINHFTVLICHFFYHCSHDGGTLPHTIEKKIRLVNSSGQLRNHFVERQIYILLTL